MKKSVASSIASYVVIWVILLAIFNVICFVSPARLAVMDKFGGAFWTGYVFITIAFVGQLICALLAFKANSLKRLFYNVPLITISYVGVIVMLVVGGLAMALPDIPNWLGIIVCFIVLAFTAIAVIKVNTAANIVSDVDEKIALKTAFIRDLTREAESLVARAKSAEVKTACKKVYEAVRYSDPMTDAGLADIEAEISAQMWAFTGAVGSDNKDSAATTAEELIILLGDRNRKCRARKV